LTTNIGDSSGALQTELSTEAIALGQLREQAERVTRDLQALHGIEVTPSSLGELIARHGECREAAELELSTAKDAFEVEVKDARSTWEREEEEHIRAAKETVAQLERERARDIEEYAYGLQIDHARVEDERAQRSKRLEHEQAGLREAKKLEWAEREKQLSEREQEVAKIEAKVEAFEGEREAAVKKAEHEGLAIARRQTKTQLELKKKDYEGVRRVFELRVESLGATIVKQETQLEELSRQLEDARTQTTQLAVKAIDGASNASSFVAIKEIALEQAKNTHKNK